MFCNLVCARASKTSGEQDNWRQDLANRSGGETASIAVPQLLLQQVHQTGDARSRKIANTALTVNNWNHTHRRQRSAKPPKAN